MARLKKVKDESLEETEESKKPKSLIERMKAKSTATSFILSDDEFPVKRYISTGNYILAVCRALMLVSIPISNSMIVSFCVITCFWDRSPAAVSSGIKVFV